MTPIAKLALYPGQVEQGNIDTSSLPVVWNGDGSYSTVNSMSFGNDRGEVLIPTVVDGRIVSPREAIDHYKKTGKHLGVFRDPDSATRYAIQLHEAERARVQAMPGMGPGIAAYESGRGAGDSGTVYGAPAAAGAAAYQASRMSPQQNPYHYWFVK